MYRFNLHPSLVLVCLLLLVAFAQSRDLVVPLTSSTIKRTVGGANHVFIKFFAPWCGHCVHLAPEYSRLADSYASRKEVVIGQVNCDEDRQLCQEYGVQGYPTLKFFPKGSEIGEVYSGPRSAEQMAEFLHEKTDIKAVIAPPKKYYVDLTPSNYEEVMMDESKYVFLQFYKEDCFPSKRPEALFTELGEYFEDEKDIVFALVNVNKHPGIASDWAVLELPTLIWFPKGEKKLQNAEDYNGSYHKEAVIAWVKRHARSNVNEKKSGLDIANVEEFIPVALEFSKGNHDRAIKMAEDIVKALQDDLKARLGRFYLRLMEQIVEDGDRSFLDREKTRLQKMVDSNKVSQTKAREFRTRLHVISQFE